MSEKKPLIGSFSSGWINSGSISVPGPLGAPSAIGEVASFSVSAIVELKRKVDAGHIITLTAPAWNAIQKLIKEEPNALRSLSPYQWEELIAAAYDKAGFDEVILTPRSGDLGRDIIATKRGFYSIQIIDQVKAYKPDHLVTANDVKSMYGVLSASDSASKGVVTTTSNFAPRIKDDPLIKKFLPTRLQLVNGEELFEHLRSLGAHET